MNPRNAGNLGDWLRCLRQTSGKTVREIAASAGMDPAILSKIERGNRLPTSAQAAALARTFALPEADVQARRIAVDFVTRYGGGESPRKALAIIRATIDRKGAHDAG